MKSLLKQLSLTEWILFIIVCLAVSLPRFYNLTLMEFKYDEFQAMVLAYKNIHSSPAAVGLVSSTSLYNPPFFIYLLSLPLLFSTDPLHITAFIAFINCMGIFLMFFLFKKFMRTKFALMGVLLFASSPWSIVFSRKIWAQNCLLPFMVLFYLLLFSHHEKPKKWKMLSMFAIFGMMSQLHMSVIFMVIPLIAYFLLTKVRFKADEILLGLVIILILYLPYIGFHFKTEFLNITSFLQHPATNGPTSFSGNLLWSFAASSGTGLDYLMGQDLFAEFYSTSRIKWAYLPFWGYFLLGISAIVFFISSAMGKAPWKETVQTSTKTKNSSILLLLLFFGIHISYIILKVPAYPHYSIVLYPILPWLIMMLVSTLSNSASNSAKPLSIILTSTLTLTISVIVVANLYTTFAFLGHIEDNATKIRGDYGTPYLLKKDDVVKQLEKSFMNSTLTESMQ